MVAVTATPGAATPLCVALTVTASANFSPGAATSALSPTRTILSAWRAVTLAA
ncbi:hypothetical protein SCYAM73S_03937 [Streptomyces cyaneofuscatus]